MSGTSTFSFWTKEYLRLQFQGTEVGVMRKKMSVSKKFSSKKARFSDQKSEAQIVNLDTKRAVPKLIFQNTLIPSIKPKQLGKQSV